MRKIELAILEAIRSKTNMNSDNSAVVVSDAGNIQVLLHGSPIVRIEGNEQNIFVSLAGWNTTVTRGRINLVLHKYGVSRVVNRGTVPEVGGTAIKAKGWFQVMRDGVEIEATAE